MSTTHSHIPESVSHRCYKCGKLLAKDTHDQTGLDIKCLRCGEHTIVFKGLKVRGWMVVTDVSGHIIFASDRAEETTGYSRAEMVGKTPALWGRQMSKEFYRELWRIILNEKKSVVARVTNRKKSGKLYTVILRISPILGTHSEIKYFVGVETPVTRKDIAQTDWSMPRME